MRFVAVAVWVVLLVGAAQPGHGRGPPGLVHAADEVQMTANILFAKKIDGRRRSNGAERSSRHEQVLFCRADFCETATS
jgi:hypothetical protein